MMDNNPKDKKNQQNEAKSSKAPADDSKSNKNKPRIKKKTPRKIFWMTTAIAEERGREEVLRVTFVDCLLYIIFIGCASVFVLGVRSTSVFYLTNGLLHEFTEKSFPTINGANIPFSDIRTAADVWKYLENHFVRTLFWEASNSDKNEKVDPNAMNILNENKVLGVPRLRQVKVRNDSCVIHEYFRRLFLTCFDTYSSEAEDKESFGLKQGTPWIYNDASKTKSLSYWGKISSYSGGGYYVDFVRNNNGSLKIITDLKKNLWITRGTRAIFIDFVIYNGNVNLFAICKFIFEFPTTGGVIPTAEIHSIKLINFYEMIDWFIFGCQACFYLFILFYTLEELRELFYFKIRYFKQFWTYVDWTIIVCSIICGVISIGQLFLVPPAIKTVIGNPEEYANLQYIADLQLQMNNLFAIDLFFVYMKVFKFVNFNKTMGQLNNTLKKCAYDILGFSIMFFIIFFAFAELGYLLFGSQVENFSSFGLAMFTLLRTILGDFQYDDIEKANRILAPIYFLSYIFLVFFVLLNMFLAIINDTYSDVKTEIAIAPDEMQMTEYLHNRLVKFLRKIGFKCVKEKSEIKTELNVTIRKIREALSKCGFSDIEIEMFFSRYNIDPLAEVKVNDVEKLLGELESILKENEDKNANKYVRLDDFAVQQDRLEQIDKTIGLLVEQVKALLLKLQEMDNVRKVQRKE